MRILRWLLPLVLTSLASAQFTTVTGTVLDPNNVPYANGTITAQLVLAGTTPVINGGSFSMTGSAGLNLSGSFTMRLADSLVMTPNANWSFTVCSAGGTIQPAGGTGPQCFTPAAITITGVSQSITAQLHAAALALASINTLPCPSCAVGPGVSVAGNVASYANTDGLTLADSGTRVAPLFSTPVVGTSMATGGVNTVLVGPVAMVTPGVDGAYRFVIQLSQTTVGSGGTCNAGSVSVNLAFKDANSGVVFSVGVNNNIAFAPFTANSATLTNAPLFSNIATSAATNQTSIAREFRAAAGTAIAYQVYEGVNSNCTTPPVFAVRPALYYMGY